MEGDCVKKEKKKKPQNIGNVRVIGYLQGELLTKCSTSPGKRSMLSSTKPAGVRVLKTALISDIKMQILEFVLLVLSRALVQYFLQMEPHETENFL